MFDLTTAGFALVDIWPEPRIRVEAYRNHPFFAMVPKDEDWVGKVLHLPVGYSNPQARSSSISTAIANKGNSSGAAFLVTSAKDYSVFSVDDETIDATKDDGGVVDAMEYESQGAMEQLVNSIANSLWNDGSGKIGQLAASGGLSGSTVTLSDPEDITQFEKGMILQASATLSGGATRAGTITVATIDRDAGAFTFTGTIAGLANSDYLYVQGDYGVKAAGVTSWIPATLTSTPFFGVDRTADSERLGGIRLANGDQNTIRETCIRLLNRVHRGKGRPRHVFMRGDSYTNLEIDMGANVQYVEAVHGDVEIGFTGIKIHGRFGQAAVYADDDTPGQTAFALELDSWKLYSRGMAPKLKRTDGNTVIRDSNSDSIEGRWVAYYQLTARSPGHNGRSLLPT